MENSILDYLNELNSPIISAVAVFLAYLLLAKIADIVADKLIRRLTKLTKSAVDDKIIDLMHRPVFFTIVFLGGIHSIKILNASEGFIFYSVALLFTLLTLLWGVCLVRLSDILIDNSIKKVSDFTGLSAEIAPLVENVWKLLVIVASGIIILSLWEIDISPLLASAGIAGVAVALAAKDTLANFFGGISIFMDKPYKIGDYIVLDQGERGEVVNIGIRSTRIKTRDDILISIPNSIIANTKVINESAPVPNFRMRIPVSVAYGSNIETIEKILLDIALKNENIQNTPEPRVRFRTFGDSSLNLELLCWAKEPSLRGKTIHEINKRIYNRFNESGVTIPFPHRTVYVREDTNWQKL